jgi:hypothetical protein
MGTGAARKYETLTRILDEYVREGAGVRQRKRFFDTSTDELRNQARSRAFIHLYLAAQHGIPDFEDREHVITDAGYDGGIDAYYIDGDRKTIEVIQSKFRSSPTNFESKSISPEELLSIDLERILRGHREDEDGHRYNGYIQAFIDKIAAIPDIARYSAKVTVLANVAMEHVALVERLFAGHETEIFDFERCYSELVLPTIRGEQHYLPSMRLQLDLSNKSGASRLSAEIITAYGPSEITVVLVPTIEIAQIMSRYKNSILRYNPRSYLEFREQRVNEGIKRSIVEIGTGEFAILNNGITIVSDETYVSERVGAKNKAQVELVNPQIINGGQTAFTLSRIYDESNDIERSLHFDNKEVILRIITLPAINEVKKDDLILSISSATNSQTGVTQIDRSASNDLNRSVAEAVFLQTGLLYEPKRGEYAEALHKTYIDKTSIVERSLFTRLLYVARGDFALGVKRRMMRETGGIIPDVPDRQTIARFEQLYHMLNYIVGNRVHARAATQIASDIALAVLAYELSERLQERNQTAAVSTVVQIARSLQQPLSDWASGRSGGPAITISGAGSRRKIRSVAWRRGAHYPIFAREFTKTAEAASTLDQQVGPAPEVAETAEDLS